MFWGGFVCACSVGLLGYVSFLGEVILNSDGGNGNLEVGRGVLRGAVCGSRQGPHREPLAWRPHILWPRPVELAPGSAAESPVMGPTTGPEASQPIPSMGTAKSLSASQGAAGGQQTDNRNPLILSGCQSQERSAWTKAGRGREITVDTEGVKS